MAARPHGENLSASTNPVIPPPSPVSLFSPLFSLPPPVFSFVFGFLTGCSSSALFQPLDVLKTKIIANGHKISIKQLWQRDFVDSNGRPQVRRLWLGLFPAFLRLSLGSGVYFSAQQALVSRTEVLNSTALLLIGGASRAAAVISCVPFSVVKTRQEAFGGRALAEAAAVWRGGGLRGFYAGIAPSVAKDAPFSAVYLLVYTNLKPISASLVSSPLAQQVSAAAMAASLATGIFQPLEVVKTRLQLQSGASGFVGVCREIYREFGVFGFYRGLAPRILRRAAANAFTWAAMEQANIKVTGREMTSKNNKQR